MLEDEFQQKAAQTDDYAEGINAFLQKRMPLFKGK
jgi:2-(1,2-epoxy-1,2-dihydrophenyl)acetyl-CoA isomerase